MANSKSLHSHFAAGRAKRVQWSGNLIASLPPRQIVSEFDAKRAIRKLVGRSQRPAEPVAPLSGRKPARIVCPSGRFPYFNTNGAAIRSGPQ